jgi:N-methylhydantoinase A
MVSVETLGAGGGSLCDARDGVLRVGPESAGADPGPVCYGRGGTRPTVTDANLVLGLLSEEAEFAGGSFRLSRKGVDEAFREHVAGPMGYGVEEAAFDCWRLVNANMTQAVRRWTAERGLDPRGLALLAYGGNGPLFAAVQAQELGIERVLVPRASPAFSALGVLAAQAVIDEERSYLTPARQADLGRMAELFDELRGRAGEYLVAAGFPAETLVSRYQATLRYPGQNWALPVVIAETRGAGAPELGERLLAQLVQRFHEQHEAEYGHARLGEEPEITGVRLACGAETPRPRFHGGQDATPRSPEPSSRRRANLGHGFCEAAIHRGPDLRPGDRIGSPAILEETFTTIAVYPGWEARVDDAGDYLLVRTG